MGREIAEIAEGLSERLLALAERCEQATGPDRVLDAEIAMAAGIAPLGSEHEGNCTGWLKAPAISFGVWKSPEFTASLDAAMTLVPEGHCCGAGTKFDGTGWAYVEPIPSAVADRVSAATPALALCAAALRARPHLQETPDA